MNNIHHIHEILHLLFGAEETYTVEALHQEILDRYGEDVQFTTCGDNLFGIDGVIPFLQSREKITLQGNNIIPLTPACDH